MSDKNTQQGGGFRTTPLNEYSSVVDWLKTHNTDSSMGYRSKLADFYGISNYTGTAQQNQQLMNKLQEDANNGTYYYQGLPEGGVTPTQEVSESYNAAGIPVSTYTEVAVQKFDPVNGNYEYIPTVETHTPFYSTRVGYPGSSMSGNFANTYGWLSGTQSTPQPTESAVTPVQDSTVNLNTNYLYGKPFFNTTGFNFYQPTNFGLTGFGNISRGIGLVSPGGTGIKPAASDPNAIVTNPTDATDSAATQKLTFKQAFAQARKAGQKEFEWNGGRYSSETAEEAAAKKVKEGAANKATINTNNNGASQYSAGVTWNDASKKASDWYMQNNTRNYNIANFSDRLKVLEQLKYKDQNAYEKELLSMWNVPEYQNVLRVHNMVPKGVVESPKQGSTSLVVAPGVGIGPYRIPIKNNNENAQTTTNNSTKFDKYPISTTGRGFYAYN